MAAHQAGNLAEAERLYRRALDVDARQYPALMMLGILYAERGRYVDAERLLSEATLLSPNDPRGHFSYGNVLLGLERFDDAFTAFGNALTLNPALAEAHLNRGNILMLRKSFAEAIACFDAAIGVNPNYAEAHCNRGHALEELKRFDEALVSCDAALALNPQNAEFHASRANILHRLGRDEEALAELSTALALQPGNANFHFNCGNILFERKRFADASEAYARALALEPELQYAEGARLHAKMHICDWSNYAAECAHMVSSIGKGIVSHPFALLAVLPSPEVQLQTARLLSEKIYITPEKPTWQGRRFNHDRIRIAYLSADFGSHAVTTLLAGMFEQHDRARFETFAISFKSHDPSEMLARLKGAFDRFIDVEHQSDVEVARLLHTLEIDIAIDLMGFTKGSRTSIFALRPSPIQINYLGFPGTMGADYIDYILADHYVVPDLQRGFYSEKIIYLPETFQGNDSKRKIDSTPISRTDVGLPKDAFVFCSFNSSNKITPDCFDIWMRLLHQKEGSVLWLLGGDSDLERNLRNEAITRGVNPDRIVFASRTSYAKYLARYRLADVFLDTFPFNAGTTASDALWAGLPIVTCSGKTFASRMAGSVLSAAGMPELITQSSADYELLASKIASDPALMASLKTKLSGSQASCALFNTQLFTQRIEEAYAIIFDRHQAGLPPADVDMRQGTGS
jgi:predicted O-linked N-acetylglucosamine transferase (SPINDLY family)